MSIKICGLGIGLPQRTVTNDELAQFVETSDNWISTRTGIKERRVATTESVLDLSFTAAQEAIESSKITANELDLIICATLQGDNITPSLACMIQNRLEVTCPAFDINAACSGFIYALEIAKNFISNGQYKKILIVCADMMSKHIDWTKRDVCVLFGDAASACVAESGDSLEYINLTTVGDDKFINHPTGSGNCPFKPVKQPAFLALNGQEVYKFAVNTVQKEIEKAFKTLDIKPEKIDNFVLHQANRRIIDAIRGSFNLPESKFPINIQKYGNTSSASILLLLYEMLQEGKLQKGDKLLMVAFGGGLTSACCVINWAV